MALWAVLLTSACGNDAPAPVKVADPAEAKLARAVQEVLRSIEARDPTGFAKLSADVEDGKVRRLKAEDVTVLVDDLHGKYGQRTWRTLSGGAPALPGWKGPVRSTLVVFGEDEEMVRLWFVEDAGELLLTRVSDEDPAGIPPKAK